MSQPGCPDWLVIFYDLIIVAVAVVLREVEEGSGLLQRKAKARNKRNDACLF